MEKIQNYINGVFEAPQGGKYFDNIEPAKGEVYSQIPDSQSEDVEKAVKAAKNAFPLWSKMSIEERGDWMMKVADGIAIRMDEFIAAESRDNGKPMKIAEHVDIPRFVDVFRHGIYLCIYLLGR